MKLKTMIKSFGIAILTLFVSMLSTDSFSQTCTGTVDVYIDSVVSSYNPTGNETTLEFVIMVKNTGATTVNMSALAPGINLGGGTADTAYFTTTTTNGTVTILEQPTSNGWTGFNNVTAQYTRKTAVPRFRQIKFFHTVSGSGTSTVKRELVTNQAYKFIKVRFVQTGLAIAPNTLATMVFSTATAAGQPVALANTIMNTYCGSAGTLLATTGLSLPTKSITLNPVVASGPTASVLTGTATICEGSSTNLSVAITGGSSPYYVRVKDASGATATATSLTTTVVIPVSPLAGTYVYTIDSVNGGGVGTGNTGSATVTVDPVTTNTTSASACSSYLWSVNGQTYTTSQTGLTVVNGCATEILNLTIGDPTIALASVGNTGSIIGSNVCGTQLQANGTSSYADGSCHPILSINTAAPLGSVTACANVMGSTPAMSNGQSFGKRWYSISPSSAGSGSVTFYYTQADFTSYNAGNGTMDMPTVGGGTANINNMRIAQIENGVLSTSTSYPAVLVWDATNGYWKATITGVNIVSGGQYYFYGEPECNLSVNAATIAASAITATSAMVTWDAVPGATGYVVRWKTAAGAWVSATSATNSRTLTPLSASTCYEVQVRTICNGGWGLNSTSGTIFCTPSAPILPACVTPTGLVASNITLSSVNLSWNTSQSVNSYYIRWRTGSGAWSAAYTTATSRTIPGLTPGTQYEAQIMLFCTGAMTASSAWSSPITFTTVAGTLPPACVTPTGLTATAITPTSATATWNAPTLGSGAAVVSYQLLWSVQNTGAWSSAYTTSLSRTLPLQANTNYEMKVKSYCSGTTGSSSAFSPVVTFSTGTPARPSVIATTTGVTIYPNPTSGDLTIDLSVENELMTTIKVLDMSGRVVKQIQASTQAGQNSIKLSIEELTTGLYTIQVINNDQVISTSRVSKN